MSRLLLHDIEKYSTRLISTAFTKKVLRNLDDIKHNQLVYIELRSLYSGQYLIDLAATSGYYVWMFF